MWPCEGIEETVVRIMDDRVFWVFGEFGLECFKESSAQSGLSIDFEVSSLSAEDLHSILGVAGDMFCIHGPNGLSEVVQRECGAFLDDYLGRSFDIFLLEIAGDFCLE